MLNRLFIFRCSCFQGLWLDGQSQAEQLAVHRGVLNHLDPLGLQWLRLVAGVSNPVAIMPTPNAARAAVHCTSVFHSVVYTSPEIMTAVPAEGLRDVRTRLQVSLQRTRLQYIRSVFVDERVGCGSDVSHVS